MRFNDFKKNQPDFSVTVNKCFEITDFRDLRFEKFPDVEKNRINISNRMQYLLEFF